MKKRGLKLGGYDTALYGWTMSALQLTDPEYQSNFQEVPGRDGPLDLSTVLTDGVPRYGSRTLTATLETSEGTRMERHARISKMVNALDGMRLDIRHPDHPAHYLTGRVQVKVSYNDLVHAAVTVTAVCDPWLYSLVERSYTFGQTPADSPPIVAALSNNGRRVVSPKIVVTTETGVENAIFAIWYSTTRQDLVGMILQGLKPGTWQLPDLQLPPGDKLIQYDTLGSECTAKITYREAVLR